MIKAKKELQDAANQAVEALVRGCELDEAAAARALGTACPVPFESPKQASLGDLAITVAMQLAKPLRSNPRAVAEKLVALLRGQPAFARWVSALEIAGPGFINLRLSDAAKQAVVSEVLSAADRFGCQPAKGEKLMVEFVSANPTGPLHVGHARQGALGDSLCHLFATQGFEVTREFYYNDAGVQIATLAASTQARIKGLKPGDAAWPESAYNGEYIADIAADFLAGKSVQADDRSFTASGDPDDLDSIRDFAVAYLRLEQDLDLQAFGVKFDSYFLESSLYSSGRVAQTVERLVSAGKTFEEGGALWLRSTDEGDDKNRVMRKSDGSYTYFVPDVAYHVAKWERGYTKCINCQGTDHHGTVARVRAGLQGVGVGIPKGYPDYVLNTMVRVVRDGAEVKISKRAGSYVTLRDLIEWTSRDAVRFFLISRKADTEFTFDVDLALKQNDENPVFYVQYAHARICSVMQQARAPGQQPQAQGRSGAELAAGADLALLTAPTELALMLKLAAYPEMLSGAARDLAPHDVAFYLRDLAGAFHSYYGAERFLVDDAALAQARLALLAATRQVLRNGLALLGVSAPDSMTRDAMENA
jgi:arginyl-tRNA synthetase